MGEVPKRIIGKPIITKLKNKFFSSVGLHQICIGQERVCKSVVDVRQNVFEQDESVVSFTVDAKNVFLYSMKIIYPHLLTYVLNCLDIYLSLAMMNWSHSKLLNELTGYYMIVKRIFNELRYNTDVSRCVTIHAIYVAIMILVTWNSYHHFW